MNSLVAPRQMAQLISAHFKELIREPGVLFWGIAFPILMALGLGVAFSKKPDVVRDIAFIESSGTGSGNPEALIRRIAGREDSTSGTRPVYRFRQSDSALGSTTFIFRKAGWAEAFRLLKRGEVSLVLAASDTGLEYRFDPLNPDAQLSYFKLSGILGRDSGNLPAVPGRVRPLEALGSRYIDFLVPGLMAMGVMMACLWGISYGLIEKRGKKLLRRMVATPMRRSHFLASLITVRVALNFVESGLLLLFTYWVFGITVQGNPLALLFLFAAGNIAFAGMAVLLSCHTANTEIGNGLISAFTMPLMVLSGVFFSYHNFPEWSVGLIRWIPLTLLADSMRSVFIEGAGFREVIAPGLFLSASGVVMFLAGLRFFKWH